MMNKGGKGGGEGGYGMTETKWKRGESEFFFFLVCNVAARISASKSPYTSRSFRLIDGEDIAK